MATSRRDPATSPPKFLGDELRRARVAAGYSSQEALAAKLGFDRSVVGKAESGERVPSPEVLAAWCDLCHLDGEHFGRLAELARSADGPVPSWFENWLEAEQEAVTLRLWSPILVPGLLQTEDYARGVSATTPMVASGVSGSAEAVAERGTAGVSLAVRSGSLIANS